MLICAAIKINLLKNNKDIVVSGRRHADAIKTLYDLGLERGVDYKVVEEGFITHKGDFLDRHKSWAHASDCGQLALSIREGLVPDRGTLYSEDLW